MIYSKTKHKLRREKFIESRNWIPRPEEIYFPGVFRESRSPSEARVGHWNEAKLSPSGARNHKFLRFFRLREDTKREIVYLQTFALDFITRFFHRNEAKANTFRIALEKKQSKINKQFSPIFTEERKNYLFSAKASFSKSKRYWLRGMRANTRNRFRSTTHISSSIAFPCISIFDIITVMRTIAKLFLERLVITLLEHVCCCHGNRWH